MLWTGRSCRRRQCWLWRKRKRATGPASAPKLRQNRFRYRATHILRFLGYLKGTNEISTTALARCEKAVKYFRIKGGCLFHQKSGSTAQGKRPVPDGDRLSDVEL